MQKGLYMHRRVRLFSILALAGITAGLFAYNHFLEELPVREQTEQTGVYGKETIRFWYADESMSDFIGHAAVAFGEEKNIRVIPELVSESRYLEAIHRASVENEVYPDVYLVSNDSLEKAYLANLACEVSDEGGVLNEEHFPAAALSAITYQDAYVGYPLYFETTTLLYNEAYLQEWAAQQEEAAESTPPDTLEALLNMADTFDAPENVEAIFRWDVSDIFYNYYMVGAYLNVGGEHGDDRAQLDICNEQTVSCLQAYQELNQFFSIESDTVDYDTVLQEFIDGRLVFTVATTDAVRALEEAKAEGRFSWEYGFATMPDVSERLQSRALSVTGVVAVNGYSAHQQEANEFAAFLTTEYARVLYEKSGKLAAMRLAEEGPEQIFRMEYEESIPLCKLMEASNLWISLEVLFAKVWNGGDAATLLQELAQQMTIQLGAL